MKASSSAVGCNETRCSLLAANGSDAVRVLRVFINIPGAALAGMWQDVAWLAVVVALVLYAILGVVADPVPMVQGMCGIGRAIACGDGWGW